jgi:16S rRNA (cytidine1402-2'-O)-methyltransferase
MEAPYRNQKILKAATHSLQSSTLFGVAANLTLPNEYIKTAPVKKWKNHLPDLHKQPALFLIYAPN